MHGAGFTQPFPVRRRVGQPGPTQVPAVRTRNFRKTLTPPTPRFQAPRINLEIIRVNRSIIPRTCDLVIVRTGLQPLVYRLSGLLLVFWLLLGSLLTSPVPALCSSPPMVGAAVALPLCTWMAVACMSMACDEERPLGHRSTFPGRRRRGMALSSGEGRGSSRRLILAFRASGIQGLMSSCLAFEPCAEFYNSRNGLAFYGKNGFSLFGPWKTQSIRRQQRASRSSPSSGNESNE